MKKNVSSVNGFVEPIDICASGNHGNHMDDKYKSLAHRQSPGEIVKSNFEHFVFVHSDKLIRMLAAPLLVIVCGEGFLLRLFSGHIFLVSQLSFLVLAAYVVFVIKKMLSHCDCGVSVATRHPVAEKVRMRKVVPKELLGVLPAIIVVAVLSAVGPAWLLNIMFIAGILAVIGVTYTGWFKRWRSEHVLLMSKDFSPAMLEGKSNEEITKLIKTAQEIGYGERAEAMSQLLIERAERF